MTDFVIWAAELPWWVRLIVMCLVIAGICIMADRTGRTKR